MGWKQCSIPRDAIDDVVAPIIRRCVALGEPENFAIFGRSDDETSSEMLLLTPQAVDLMGNALPPTWVDEADPYRFGWSRHYGPEDALERHELQTPTEKGEDV